MIFKCSHQKPITILKSVNNRKIVNPFPQQIPLALAMVSIISSPLQAMAESENKKNPQDKTQKKQESQKNSQAIEEVNVLGNRFFIDTTRVSPTSVIGAETLTAVNLVNTEDTLAHEPSLVVRKRFIGDANGVIGLRGSHMFQTARSLVFVDGMPLHYHLQTRWNGAPRWSLVSPNDIAEVEVVYGPFSSEYSGNAMGGVINIRSRRPENERFSVDVGSFSQSSKGLTGKDRLDGYRTYLAYENRWGDWSASLSMTHLENKGQPQSYLSASLPRNEGQEASIVASGAVNRTDAFGGQAVYIGDTGVEDTANQLYNARAFYEGERLAVRASAAYETRERGQEHPRLLLNNNGSPVFDRYVIIDDTVMDTYRFGSSQFQTRSQDRDSLLLGVGATYALTDNWVTDGFYSHFRILEDVEVRSGANPSDPAFEAVNARDAARRTHYDDTGWEIADVKLETDNVMGDERQRLAVGVHYDHYSLNLRVDDFNRMTGQVPADELDGNRNTGRADSGGEARTTAVFAQYGIELSPQWDLSLGLRYDDWRADEGFIGGDAIPVTSKTGWSPKLSLAYFLNDNDALRYSAARALRFPLIEELFINNSDVSGGSQGNAGLLPENGIFHNLSYQRQWEDGGLAAQGEWRVNAFYDRVREVIVNQTDVNTNITSFIPIDDVETKGLEAVINAQSLFGTALDARFNVTYTDAKIAANQANPELVGNRIPRLPRWRANLLLNYPLAEQWALGASARYASNSFGRLDNRDTEQNVFGATDGYLFVGAKLNWQASKSLKMSAGVDNIFNEAAFIHHPWPGRSLYLQLQYALER